MEIVDRLERRVAGAAAAFALRVLRARAQERELLVQDVLDAEKHVAEARPLHQRRERLAVIRDGRGHPLDHVVDVLEPGMR